MRIAQVAPLYERVPPIYYGGTERIVSYLTEELIEQGHDLTLFASGDSLTGARLVSPCARSLRLDPDCIDPLAHFCLMLEMVFEQAGSFDMIHYHIDYLHFPFSKRNLTPHVTTLHGRLDLPDLVPLYRRFAKMPVISISDTQRAPLPCINWQGTVHHGIPTSLYALHRNEGSYLAFLGRISPEKRVDRAIEIAKLAKMKLKIAAKVDRVDSKYMEKKIKPLLDHPLVEFIGEIGEEQKEDFLGNAYALLFPIDWCEPFGLVMIESMACGTPIIAYNQGSVPEVVDEGRTGFIVNGVEESVRALEKVRSLDRLRCRRIFEERFSATRMANDYVKIYEKLLRKRCDRRAVKMEKKPIPTQSMAEIRNHATKPRTSN
jgi:glycosyltransferase involved in cell wall biosynthesis